MRSPFFIGILLLTSCSGTSDVERFLAQFGIVNSDSDKIFLVSKSNAKLLVYYGPSSSSVAVDYRNASKVEAKDVSVDWLLGNERIPEGLFRTRDGEIIVLVPSAPSGTLLKDATAYVFGRAPCNKYFEVQSSLGTYGLDASTFRSLASGRMLCGD